MHIENYSTVTEEHQEEVLDAAIKGIHLKIRGQCPKYGKSFRQSSENCPGTPCLNCPFYKLTDKQVEVEINQKLGQIPCGKEISHFVEADRSIKGATVYKIWEVQKNQLNLIDLNSQKPKSNTRDVAESKVIRQIEFAQYDQETDRKGKMITKKGEYELISTPC